MATKAPLFSTYRQGENRVTGSVLAVFQRIDAGHLARLLSESTGESDLAFVSFANQAAGSGGSVPDAEISASFHYLFEVKTATNALTKQQLAAHLKHFKSERAHQRLFVLTPDPEAPAVVEKLGDERVAWLSFRSLDRAVAGLLEDGTELVSEQERFLLHEMRALFEHEGLLEHRDTVVVAARVAYPEYLTAHAYVCQPGRPFRAGLDRLGFYAGGAIQREVPLILYREDQVVFSADEATARKKSGRPGESAVGAVVERLLGTNSRVVGESYQVFVLSPPDADETLRLDHPIKNTKVDRNGRPWAWTMSQTYVEAEALRKVSTTSELDA